MFHLFNRVYLEHEESVDLRNNRVVLSATKGFEPLLNEHMQHGKVIYCSANTKKIDQAEFARILTLIKDDHPSEKIVIYCDAEAYPRLVSYWVTAAMHVVNRGESVDLHECLTLVINETCRFQRNATKSAGRLVADSCSDTERLKWMRAITPDCALVEMVKDRWAYVSVHYILKKALLDEEDGISKDIVTSLAKMFILRFYDELAFEYCEQIAVSYGTMVMSSHGKVAMDFLYNYNGHFFIDNKSVDALSKHGRIEVVNNLKYISEDIIGYGNAWMAQAFQYQNLIIDPMSPFTFDDAVSYFDKIAHATMLNSLFPSKDVENVDIEALLYVLGQYKP